MTQARNFVVAFLALLLIPVPIAKPFAFIFASESNPDIVTHPIGYSGTGGAITISVGINPGSPNAAQMVIPTQNVINIFNKLFPGNGNLIFGSNNNVPSGQLDFESTLLHELGHSLGLAHVNAATESGLTGDDQNYTKAGNGADNVFNLNPGTDGIIGSADDVRGDDLNLNYFKISDNNPFTIEPTVDATTYSRDVADLPSGHNFSTNGDRAVAAGVYAISNTECVMQQGTYYDEAQRFLTTDDVAGLRYAMAGLDEIAGTADDYTFELVYAGMDASADIVIQFDNSETGFAVSKSSGIFLGASGHMAIISSNIYFNTGFAWFFNDVSNSVFPVEFVAFEVNKEKGRARLDWATASESNSSFFVVERSANGSSWEAVGRVAAVGNSQSQRHYHFYDEGAGQAGSLLFYRLKEVDQDGNFMYSEMVEYAHELTPLSTLEFAPNPINSQTLYEWEAAEAQITSFSVFNMEGKMLFQHHLQARKGYNRFQLGKHLDLQPGLYVLQVIAGPHVQSLKFIINN
ncbi:MAG: T9SS C-terminal target domain-containing protein [Bacteroidetes bacterium]|nr:MAG: T9SS C-terminal target domain-containing protein [Bacteroidota bacterium]